MPIGFAMGLNVIAYILWLVCYVASLLAYFSYVYREFFPESSQQNCTQNEETIQGHRTSMNVPLLSVYKIQT